MSLRLALISKDHIFAKLFLRIFDKNTEKRPLCAHIWTFICG